MIGINGIDPFSLARFAANKIRTLFPFSIRAAFLISYLAFGKPNAPVVQKFIPAKEYPDFITVTCLNWMPLLKDDIVKKL